MINRIIQILLQLPLLYFYSLGLSTTMYRIMGKESHVKVFILTLTTGLVLLALFNLGEAIGSPSQCANLQSGTWT